MQTLVLLIEYEGTHYAGWQIQPNATTVQGLIEEALFEICEYNISIIGAGRTDSGVHARGQVAHARLTEEFPVPIEKIPKAFNTHLPKDIRIKDAVILSIPFHSRFDAIAREYSYSLITKESVFLRHFATYYKYPIKPERLNDSAKIFFGKHDFTTFSKLNEENKNYECNVEICRWENVFENYCKLTIKANHFVYGMVRAIVGAMLDIARGKRTIDDVQSALKKRDRSLASPLAPAEGLILEKIYYPADLKIFE